MQYQLKQENQIKAGVWLCILLISFIALSGCSRGRGYTVPSYDEELDPVDEVELFAIVSSVDEVNQKITLRAVNYQTQVTVSFNGGTDVQDKYGNILAMSQVQPGSVVDAIYDANRDKLLSLYISRDEKVKKLEGISGAIVDTVENTLRFSGKVYSFSKNATALSDNREIGVNEICSEDQISVWLYNDMICSVYVELGHGYVRLSDFASYIGGMVEIGYDVIVPVTEEMLLTVREGDYTLRIAKGEDFGTKKVKVIKNQEVNISLADIMIEPKQKGSVLFKVTPAGAAVYIDGKRVNTEGAIQLTYGKHKIYITADGYQTYSASFQVDYAYKVKEYTLVLEDEEAEDTSTGTTQSVTTETDTNEKTTEEEKKTTTEDTTKDVSTVTGTKTSNKVTVTAPNGASVYFDGEYLGIAPISFTKVTGSHIITLSKMGYLSKSYTVTFTDDGKDENLSYEELISISSLIE